MVDNATDIVSAYFEVLFEAGQGAGNFGHWCLHKPTLFCQEREGCANCLVARQK